MSTFIGTETLNIDSIWQTIIGFFLCYLIGSIIFAQVASIITGIDISKYGSGNLGATNTNRVLGKKISILVFLGDFLKGYVSFVILLLIKVLGGFKNIIIPVSLIGCIIGHCFPIFNKFKGGKGVSTGFGLMSILNWPVTLIAILVWIILIKMFKYVALSSIVASWVALILMWIPDLNDLSVIIDFVPNYWWIVPLSVTIVVLIITIKHKSNIINLINGEEIIGTPKIKKENKKNS